MSGFEVIKAGVFTLLQDNGRFDYTHLGVTTSGFLDEYSALWAHKLLGNKTDDNLLEIAFSNVEMKSLGNITISITGASCEFFINGNLKPIWQSYNIKAGDIIKVGKILSGNRVYIAVKNGFKIKKEFGSYSTSIKENLGGLNGNKLLNNDFLGFEKCDNNIEKRVGTCFIPSYKNELVLRVILSYQEDSFKKEEKEKLFNSTYKVTSDFNRMACKLSGEKIKSDLNGITSEGISFGAIQMPKDGQPIILLKDRQTIGGYPKIGSVLSVDCFKLAQAKIGTEISFEEISISEAQNKTKLFYSSFF